MSVSEQCSKPDPKQTRATLWFGGAIPSRNTIVIADNVSSTVKILLVSFRLSPIISVFRLGIAPPNQSVALVCFGSGLLHCSETDIWRFSRWGNFVNWLTFSDPYVARQPLPRYKLYRPFLWLVFLASHSEGRSIKRCFGLKTFRMNRKKVRKRSIFELGLASTGRRKQRWRK